MSASNSAASCRRCARRRLAAGSRPATLRTEWWRDRPSRSPATLPTTPSSRPRCTAAGTRRDCAPGSGTHGGHTSPGRRLPAPSGDVPMGSMVLVPVPVPQRHAEPQGGEQDAQQGCQQPGPAAEQQAGGEIERADQGEREQDEPGDDVPVRGVDQLSLEASPEDGAVIAAGQVRRPRRNGWGCGNCSDSSLSLIRATREQPLSMPTGRK
jgi:hypothetical protein